MRQAIFHVRPRDDRKGWAIDCYDGRGAWEATHGVDPQSEPMDKIQAQRAVFQLRRKPINSARKTPASVRASQRGAGLILSGPSVPVRLPAARRARRRRIQPLVRSTCPSRHELWRHGRQRAHPHPSGQIDGVLASPGHRAVATVTVVTPTRVGLVVCEGQTDWKSML